MVAWKGVLYPSRITGAQAAIPWVGSCAFSAPFVFSFRVFPLYFCLPLFPLEGWQPVDILFMPSSRFFRMISSSNLPPELRR